MAIDSYGVVYVVHPTWSNGTIIMKESGGSWVPVSTSGLPASMAFPSIKFDSNNVAYLAYTGGDTGFGLQASCSKLLNNKWIHVGNSNISSSSSAASNTNLHIIKSNEIYIGFDDPYISCYKFNNEINYWKMIGTSGMGGNYGGLADLISDSNSNIYISTSQISGDKAMCFTFNGSDWVMVGNSPISESYASSPNIAVNNYGKIYAAYSDANLNKAVVKEYNVPTGTVNFTKKDRVLIYPNPSSAFFNIEFDRQKFDVAVYEIKGNLIAEYHDINVKSSVNSNVFKNGIYIIKVSAGNEEPYYGKLRHCGQK